MSSQTEDIKARLNIVDLIQSYIRLEKAGINFRARCPFHQEKSPSFFVSPTRQSWRCFGCQKGGDHFTFVEEIEHVDFPEALEILANRAGIQLKKEDPRVVSERTRLYAISEEAAKFFEQNLWQKNPNRATPMMQYLLSRGLNEESIKQFRIGFAPDSWDALFSHLIQKGFHADEMEKVGLIIKKENIPQSGASRNYYDRFRSRIMFPIMDTSGRVIAFGGRIYTLEGKPAEDTAGAKYINSPETPIYNKSRVLYAFDKAKSAIREKNECVLVEGYMDAVMSRQAGVINAVAVSGTALTPEQLKLIQRLTDKIVFAFDMDSAGQSATKRSLDLAGELDLQRKVMILPSGKDPADAVAENPKVLLDALAHSRPLMDYYMEDMKKRFDLRDPLGKKQAGAFFIPHIKTLKNEIERSHWIQTLAENLGVPEVAIRLELDKLRPTASVVSKPPLVQQEKSSQSRRGLLERELLSLYILHPEVVEKELAGYDEPVPFSGLLHEKFFNILKVSPKPITVTLFADDVGATTLYQELQFRAELLKDEDKNIPEEVRVCASEIFRDYYRDKMQDLHLQIKDLEKRGNRDRMSALLKTFHEYSSKIKKF